jgi:hypothetical protein
VAAVVLLLVTGAVVAQLAYSYRKNRPPPLTAEELEEMVLEARREEDAREDAFWDQHRVDVRKLLADVLQQSGRSDLRMVEDRAEHTWSLVGRMLHTEEYPFVTIGTRAERFYYTSREAGTGGEAGALNSPKMAAIEDLRRWLVDQWTYGS